MYIQNFNRHEIKYLVTADMADTFIKSISDYISPNDYGSYTIRNVYLDTHDFYFISHSLQKPIYKEKLRIRQYGGNDSAETVYFEIKKKFQKTVFKRRLSMSPDELSRYLSDGTAPHDMDSFIDRQIFSEIDWLMKKHSPVPKLYLAYDREAYYYKSNPEIRITFDRNIRYRLDSLTLDNDTCCSMLDTGIKDYRLIEIKALDSIPLEITQKLSEFNIYPSSFSKYGRIFNDVILPQRKELVNV